MEEDSRRGTSWPLYVVGSLFLLVVFMLAAWNIELPYLAFSSGPVSDAADAIVAEGVDTFPPDGELLMLTVVSQDVNVFEAVIAGLDPSIDLVRREAYRRPDESDEDYRNRTLQQMEDSQTRAIAVALGELGYQMAPAGVVIVEVLDDKPAAEVLEVGDLLVSIAGRPVEELGDVTGALEGFEPGDEVEFEIIREGSDEVVLVELVERGDEMGGPMIGITLHEQLEPPFPLRIEAGAVGGPSAGMMHTLAIIDTLTPGELTKGQIVAGTGTINGDGSVGNIGGVRQKVVGAQAAGAAYVLVPAGNYEEALTAEVAGIQIVPVGSLTEALAFFDALVEPPF